MYMCIYGLYVCIYNYNIHYTLFNTNMFNYLDNYISHNMYQVPIFMRYHGYPEHIDPSYIGRLELVSNVHGASVNQRFKQDNDRHGASLIIRNIKASDAGYFPNVYMYLLVPCIHTYVTVVYEYIL